MCKWLHLYGKQGRVTKETLDEGEKVEWKAGLRQHSKN